MLVTTLIVLGIYILGCTFVLLVFSLVEKYTDYQFGRGKCTLSYFSWVLILMILVVYLVHIIEYCINKITGIDDCGEDT